MTFAPLIYSAVAAAGLTARRSATLKLPRLYLAFTVLAGIAGMIIPYVSSEEIYTAAFVLVTFTNNVLLCLVALEIISVLVPRRFAEFWGTCFLLIFGLVAVRQWPGLHDVAGWLNLTVSADLTAGILLMALVFVPDLQWTREHGFTAAGVALSLLADALPSIRLLQGNPAGVALALQFAPLIGLVLLAIAPIDLLQKSNRNQKAFTVFSQN